MDEPQAQARDAFPDQARVVIVGGGVIGASIAYHLAKLGWTRRRPAGAPPADGRHHLARRRASSRRPGMATETLLWMARYTRDLCTTLEAETGQATGFRPIGHLHLATTPQRLETLRREAAFVRGFGVDNQEISAAEFARHWPAAKTDDVLAAFYVPDEGRVNPADLTQAYARGARMNGARIVEGVTVTGVTQAKGFVTGVETDRGPIRAEYVVNAAGMWGREVGAMAGVSVPLQAAEHYYLITDTVDWAHPDLPIVEDPDRYGYYREEGGGILVGLFEPRAAAWSLDRVPRDVAFASLPPDWDRVGPYLDDGDGPLPVPARGRHPDDVLRSGELHAGRDAAAGRGPGAAQLLRRRRAQQPRASCSAGGVGSLTAQWIADGVPPVDVTGLTVDRTQVFETSRRFRRDRAVEQLGRPVRRLVVPDLARLVRAQRPPLRHPRPAGRRAGRASRSRPGGSTRSGSTSTARTRSCRRAGGGTPRFDYQAAEHRAVREAVGMLDMSIMAKLLVQGRDAETVLNRVCANDVSVPVGRVVYTQWLNEAGGIIADLTVTRLAETRFLLVVTDLGPPPHGALDRAPHRRRRVRDRHGHDRRDDAAHRPGAALAGAAVAASRARTCPTRRSRT